MTAGLGKDASGGGTTRRMLLIRNGWLLEDIKEHGYGLNVELLDAWVNDDDI